MAEAVGIKETLELLDGVKVLVRTGKRVMSDGKVSISDLPEFLDLVNKFALLNAAYQGADLIVAEAKNLSAEEAQMIIAKVMEIAKAAKGLG